MKTDLDTLKNAIKITDLARELGLQVRNHQARCFNTPAHSHGDKKPSLGLNAKTNRFKCFACGVSGSIIDLYKEVKGVSVAEAINALTEMANLNGTLPTQGAKGAFKALKPLKQGKTSPDPIYGPEATQKPLTDEIMAIYKDLKDFCGNLDDQSLAYLTGPTRGLTKETITRFGLFSINDYEATNKYMREKYGVETLREAGLIGPEKENLIFYKHKIMIPFIKDGRIIFLQGRRIDGVKELKYLNTSQATVLFNDYALKTLTRGERVYICEGVFDAMRLEQEGYKAVAILGVTNFKPAMAKLFTGFEVVLCLDNDEQGKRATKTIADIFLAEGQSVKTKRLPDGIKDITEYFTKGV